MSRLFITFIYQKQGIALESRRRHRRGSVGFLARVTQGKPLKGLYGLPTRFQRHTRARGNLWKFLLVNFEGHFTEQRPPPIPPWCPIEAFACGNACCISRCAKCEPLLSDNIGLICDNKGHKLQFILYHIPLYIVGVIFLHHHFLTIPLKYTVVYITIFVGIQYVCT